MKTSKLSTFFLIALTVPLLAVVATIVAAGVTVTITNQSPGEVRRASLAHAAGVMTVGPLNPGERTSRFVGKLGEGAHFNLRLQRGSQCFEAPFDVYFYSSYPWTTVHVELIGADRVRVREGDSWRPRTVQTVLPRRVSCDPATSR